jgi:c-di-GMP-binding flagellar brake protein YcgR
MATPGKKEILRKSARIKLEILAVISLTPPGKKNSEMISVSIKSLSVGGIMIVTPTPLQEGLLVEMTLFFQPSPISFMASVVWTDQTVEKNQKKFECGLKFRSISDDDILYIQNFIYKQLQLNPNSAT